jgi:triosephosphate isomerase
MIPKLIVANWKMAVDLDAVRAFEGEWNDCPAVTTADVVVAPPAVFVHHAAALHGVSLCGQDVSIHSAGAHTGEVSAAMLKALGCRYGIVGHSERRSGHSETNAVIAEKALRLETEGLRPIICVGESLLERQSGGAESVIAAQVTESCRGLNTIPIIAYEPVWAIGSGESASPNDVVAMHRHIKQTLDQAFAADVPVLYGGSVNPENCTQFTAHPEVNGLLVGGASLNARQFWNMCSSVEGQG